MQVALKILEWNGIAPVSQKATIDKEVSIMRLLKHANIGELFDVLEVPGTCDVAIFRMTNDRKENDLFGVGIDYRRGVI